MEEVRAQLLRRFFSDPQRMSRNRNFNSFLDPKVDSALRIGRFLRSLREDLLESNPHTITLRNGEVANGASRYVLELFFKNGYRRSYLSQLELAILREDDQVDQVLRGVQVG